MIINFIIASIAILFVISLVYFKIKEINLKDKFCSGNCNKCKSCYREINNEFRK